MTQLLVTFIALSVAGIIFLLWMKTKSGKKWLKSL